MNIFISYRRSDSQDISARIADRLNDTPGVSEVFIDVDEIDPGVNFAASIDQALKQSDVCLVLIGSDWIGNKTGGASARIFDPDDFVRHEISASLASGNKVIPVLLNGAMMPKADILPEDISSLSLINSVFIRHASFNQDLGLLEDAIFSRRPRSPLMRFFRRHPVFTRFIKSLGGMVVSGAALVGLAVVHSIITHGRTLAETFGSVETVWLLIISFLLLGAAIPLLFPRRQKS